MKKILITEKQEQIINQGEFERLSNDIPEIGCIPVNILKDLFSLGYEDSVANFNDDITTISKDRLFNDMSKCISKCQKIESKHKVELEKLCSDVVIDYFSIPKDEVKIETELDINVPDTKDMNVSPDFKYNDVEEMNSVKDFVKKRKTINLITRGASMCIADKIMRNIIGDLFDIDEDLPRLYSRIIKINEYLVNSMKIKISDKRKFQGGFSELKLGRGSAPVIESHGVVFPILLIETIKGVLDIFASYSLPDDRKLAEIVCLESDTVESDPWEMRIGKSLWKMFEERVDDLDGETLPFFLKDVFTSDNFEDIVLNVVCKTTKGDTVLKDILSKCTHDREYKDFLSRIDKKREDNKNLIIDNEIICENDNGWHVYYDYLTDYDERYVLDEFFRNPKGKQDWGVLINPDMYQKALSEFTRYGQFINFPAKYVYQWMGIIMKNTAILRASTALAGHSEYFPGDVVSEVAEEHGYEIDDSYEEGSEWLDEIGYYDWSVLPDGSDAMSDFGLDPIEKVINEYNENLPPEKVLVLINRILDIYHCRGDLSSIFIQGGSRALSAISA